VIDWADYPNFSEKEFACSHTGEAKMLPEFMARLQRLRTAYGKPMVITSGYRSLAINSGTILASPVCEQANSFSLKFG